MSSKLVVNGKCLAYHGPLLYEAKILRIYTPGSKEYQTKDGPVPFELPAELPQQEILYYVHYKGWKSSWDEWVGQERVLAYNFENIKIQKELKQAALRSTKTIAVTSSKPPETVTGPETSSSKKRRRVLNDAEVEKEADFLKRPEIHLLIPDELKSQLVDDWELVTKDKKLVTIPSKQSVRQILTGYASHVKSRRGSVEQEIMTEFLSGLKVYFDRSLGKILLYRFERGQYLELEKNPETQSRDASDIYGAEHLLRLCVQLPALIAQTTMDQQSVAVLKQHLEDFMAYLVKNEGRFFQKWYYNPAPHYDRE